MTPIDTTQIRELVQEAKEATKPRCHIEAWSLYRPSREQVCIANLAEAVEMLCDLIDQKDEKFSPQGAP